MASPTSAPGGVVRGRAVDRPRADRSCCAACGNCADCQAIEMYPQQRKTEGPECTCLPHKAIARLAFAVAGLHTESLASSTSCQATPLHTLLKRSERRTRAGDYQSMT